MLPHLGHFMGGCAGRFLADFLFFEPAFLSSMPPVADSIVEAAITQTSLLFAIQLYGVALLFEEELVSDVFVYFDVFSGFAET
jgi:hypothetical protein